MVTALGCSRGNGFCVLPAGCVRPDASRRPQWQAKKEAQPETEARTAPKAKRKALLPPAKRKLSLKLIIIIAAGALVVLGGGGTGAYFLFRGHGEAQAAASPVKPATFFDLPEVLVNLANAGADRTQYLKIKVVLELPDPKR